MSTPIIIPLVVQSKIVKEIINNYRITCLDRVFIEFSVDLYSIAKVSKQWFHVVSHSISRIPDEIQYNMKVESLSKLIYPSNPISPFSIVQNLQFLHMENKVSKILGPIFTQQLDKLKISDSNNQNNNSIQSTITTISFDSDRHTDCQWEDGQYGYAYENKKILQTLYKVLHLTECFPKLDGLIVYGLLVDTGITKALLATKTTNNQLKSASIIIRGGEDDPEDMYDVTMDILTAITNHYTGLESLELRTKYGLTPLSIGKLFTKVCTSLNDPQNKVPLTKLTMASHNLKVTQKLETSAKNLLKENPGMFINGLSINNIVFVKPTNTSVYYCPDVLTAKEKKRYSGLKKSNFNPETKNGYSGYSDDEYDEDE